VDLQERRQLDMAASMAKVRARARPWRAILSLLIAVAAAAAEVLWGKSGTTTGKAIMYGCAAAFFVFGMAAAFGLSGQARSRLQPVIGQAHAGMLRYAAVLISLFILLVATLQLAGVSPRQLVVGGAVTGVLLGIAAQQSLANLFAGLVLLFARPFMVGDHVRFRAGALAGQIEGIVTDVSLTYVRLQTEDGRVLIPNSQVLASAVLVVQEPAGGSGPPPGTWPEAPPTWPEPPVRTP
jgi:small-conductance mechanosensitive channel